MIESDVIKILKERRLYYLRQANFYQGLSVSPEHWHTERKEAYRESSISMKKYSKAMWFAIKQFKAK